MQSCQAIAEFAVMMKNDSRAQEWPNEWCAQDRTDDRNTASDYQFARRGGAQFAGSTPRKVAAKACTLAFTITPRRAESRRAYQTMGHPACDFARQMMLVSLAGTGVHLSDGATNILPVGPHRAQSKASH